MKYGLAILTIIINICVSYHFSNIHIARLQSQVAELASLSSECANRTQLLEEQFQGACRLNDNRLDILELSTSSLENSRDELERETYANKEDIETIVKILRHRGVK